MGAAGAVAGVAELTPPRERPPEAPLTVRAAVGAASARLHDRGMATPWLEATVLLAHAIGISKERLFAVYPEPLPEDARNRFERLLARREAGEPVAYLRGYKEFYGRPFIVDRRVLIPRPETELLVEALLACGDALAAGRGSVALHDVGHRLRSDCGYRPARASRVAGERLRPVAAGGWPPRCATATAWAPGRCGCGCVTCCRRRRHAGT